MKKDKRKPTDIPLRSETTEENLADDTPETEPAAEDLSRDPAESAKKLADEYLDALQRLKAEFDNFRKRTAKERQKLSELHQSIVLEAILPSLDSFDAALRNPGAEVSEGVYRGLKLIYDGLMDNLSKLDFHRMDVLDKPFDPETSEAILVQQTDHYEPGVVIGEISAGYTFRNSVLRPARVVVSASTGKERNDNPEAL